MRLLIDIGNTQVKYVFQAKAMAPLTDVVYLDYQSFEQQMVEGTFSQVSEVILANVHSSDIVDALEKWTKANNCSFLQVHSTAKALGVTSAYALAERLGVDRWLAMIGAKQLYPNENLLIIDAGTATTVDLLDASGQHLGGWIMPGVQTMFNSLLVNTKKIIAKPNVTASVLFGKDSSNCLNNGSWAMTIGAVKEAIIQANELLTLDRVLITGGNGGQINNLITEVYQLEPQLIFHGLSCFRAT